MEISEDALLEIAAILAAGVVSSEGDATTARHAVKTFERVLAELERRYRSEPVE